MKKKPYNLQQLLDSQALLTPEGRKRIVMDLNLELKTEDW